MKLPDADQIKIERGKIVDYLLNAAHPDNGGKAKFFERLGFRQNRWEALAKALKASAMEPETTRIEESPHGRKYVIVGRLESLEGKFYRVQTIWIMDNGSESARLVTAYPYNE